jgi:hypothetical protein
MTTEQSLPPPAPPAPSPLPAAARPTSALAIVSLVSGILGWTVIPFIGSLAAVVCGHLARAEIRRDPRIEGDGMAIAGLVLGWVNIALCVLGIIAVVLFFGGLAAVIAAIAAAGG